MSASKTLLAAFLGAALSVGASAGIANAESPASAAQKTTAEHDFARLSKDGARGFEELRLARIAIFNADPLTAQSWVDAATTAFERAKTDETVYMKAESELSVVPKLQKALTTNDKDAQKDAQPSTKKIAWLPVDTQMILGEDFTATPEKKAALEAANKSLAKGDKKEALEKLKLAEVDVSSIVALVPLDQTISDVKAADSLMAQRKYYEASVLLKNIGERARYLVVSETGVPKKDAGAAKNDADAPKKDAK